MPTKTKDALETYNTLEKDNLAKLDHIELLLVRHGDPDNTNYGHVGDMRHVAELLDEAISFLNGNGGE